jgi:hypothetical protein
VTPPPAPTRRERFLTWLRAGGSSVRTWLSQPALAGGTAVLGLLLAFTVFLLGDGVAVDDAPASPSASNSSIPSTPRATSRQAPDSRLGVGPCNPTQEIIDDFGDGLVDTCRWLVSNTEPGIYYRKTGLLVIERDGMLVFDVPEVLSKGGDAEIFALPNTTVGVSLRVTSSVRA